MQTAINLRFSKRLQELRKKHKYTQQELADLAGVGYKHYQRYEGENPPLAKLDFIEKIAKAFKMSPSKLLDF